MTQQYDDAVREKRRFLIIIVIGAYITGIIFTLAGIWLIYLNSVGKIEFNFFGQTFKSGNVGIAAIFLGAVTIILIIRRTLKSEDIDMGRLFDITKTEGGAQGSLFRKRRK